MVRGWKIFYFIKIKRKKELLLFFKKNKNWRERSQKSREPLGSGPDGMRPRPEHLVTARGCRCGGILSCAAAHYILSRVFFFISFFHFWFSNIPFWNSPIKNQLLVTDRVSAESRVNWRQIQKNIFSKCENNKGIKWKWIVESKIEKGEEE
jgi:hypothetical protein